MVVDGPTGEAVSAAISIQVGGREESPHAAPATIPLCDVPDHPALDTRQGEPQIPDDLAGRVSTEAMDLFPTALRADWRSPTYDLFVHAGALLLGPPPPPQ